MFWKRKKEEMQLPKLTIAEAQKITELCKELEDLEKFLEHHRNSYFPNQLKLGVWDYSMYLNYFTSKELTNSIVSAVINRVEELKNILKNYDQNRINNQ